MAFPSFGTMWEDVKAVAHLFHARTGPRAFLRKELEERDYRDKRAGVPLKGVKRVCELRFANSFMVIDRLIRIEERMKSVVVSGALAEWIQNLPRLADRAECRRLKALLTDDVFWLKLTEYVRLLTPIYTFLREVDSNATMIGDVYHRMSQIQDTFTARPSSWLSATELKGVKKAWVYRWDYLHSDIYAAGKKYIHFPNDY